MNITQMNFRLWWIWGRRIYIIVPCTLRVRVLDKDNSLDIDVNKMDPTFRVGVSGDSSILYRPIYFTRVHQLSYRESPDKIFRVGASGDSRTKFLYYILLILNPSNKIYLRMHISYTINSQYSFTRIDWSIKNNISEWNCTLEAPKIFVPLRWTVVQFMTLRLITSCKFHLNNSHHEFPFNQ